MKLQALQFKINSKTINLHHVKSVIIFAKVVSGFQTQHVSVARVWKSTLCSVSKAVEQNWRGSTSSGVAGQLTARNAKPPCSVFQLVLSKFEAQSEVAKAPSDKHCIAWAPHSAVHPKKPHIRIRRSLRMRARGPSFLLSCNETSDPTSEVTSHTQHGMRALGASFLIEMRA